MGPKISGRYRQVVAISSGLTVFSNWVINNALGNKNIRYKP